MPIETEDSWLCRTRRMGERFWSDHKFAPPVSDKASAEELECLLSHRSFSVWRALPSSSSVWLSIGKATQVGFSSVLLFLALDLFMLGYLANRRAGAALYNVAHTLLTPGLLLAIGFLAGKAFLPLALIWTTHIGLDRVLGYGLKYPTHFKDTHLQHV